MAVRMKMKDRAAIKPKKGDKFIAMFDYASEGPDELSVTKGDALELVTVTPDSWWEAKNTTKASRGFISANIIAPVGSLDLEDWCHGKITRNAAEYLLNKEKITGTFIVRESQSQPGDYTLSLMDAGKVIHYRINESDKGVCIGPGRQFDTIQLMIENYRKKADGIPCQLKNTIPKAHAKAMIISKETEKKWELKREDVTLGKMLGAGNFGEVWLGTYGRVQVAIKTIKEDSMEAIEFVQEAHIMKKLTHENLVRLIGVCSVDMPMYIVTEFVNQGDLLSYLRRREAKAEIDLSGQLHIATQICSGMKFLEENNTIHRDLAARNCLVADNLVIKIADFGMGREIDELYTARTGTKMPVKWSAPEALCYNAFSCASDVWSFGITLWEISTFGDSPYNDIESVDILTKLEEGYRMPMPKKCLPGMYAIMLQTWEMDASKRPSFSTLYDALDALKEPTPSDPLPPTPVQASDFNEGYVNIPKKERRPKQEEALPAIPTPAAHVNPFGAPGQPPALPKPRSTTMSSSSSSATEKQKEWRMSYRKNQTTAATGLTLDIVDLGIDLTKDAFSKTQQIIRHGTEENIAHQLEELLEPLNVMVERCKIFSKADSAVVEAFKVCVAGYHTISKIKPNVEKLKPSVKALSEGTRNLNKALKATKQTM